MDGQVEAAHDRITDGDGGGMDFDQHFPLPGRGFSYLLEQKNIRWPVFFINYFLLVAKGPTICPVHAVLARFWLWSQACSEQI